MDAEGAFVLVWSVKAAWCSAFNGSLGLSSSTHWEAVGRKGVREVQNVDKAEWLKAIGAKEFPEPVKYAYTFPGYSGAFNLSERYVEESDLKELKAQYEKNKAHALEVIKAKKELDTHC